MPFRWIRRCRARSRREAIEDSLSSGMDDVLLDDADDRLREEMMWALMPSTVEEAVALRLGLDPEDIPGWGTSYDRDELPLIVGG